MDALRRTYKAALGVIALTCVSPVIADTRTPLPVTKETIWRLRLPQVEMVSYKGLVNYDQAGTGNTQFLYPAPNALGFLAAVLTHGAIVESQKKAQKDQLQEEADKVLVPYEPVLKSYSHRELMQRALEKAAVGIEKRLLAADEKTESEWVAVSVPVFSMTQDQSAIVLENAIALYPPSATEPAYKNAVRVISRPSESRDLTGFWSTDGGARLKEESASLLAHSLEIAIADAAAPETGSTQRTFRYFEGASERIERAGLVSERCDRAIIRTLRGWLMSIPVNPSACGGKAS